MKPGDEFKPSAVERARQQGLVLAALRAGPLTTIAARETLGIAHPAGRVHELRRMGYRIETGRRVANDAAGRKHQIASYVLVQSEESCLA